uniref:Putative membrane glycoprotein lig-1 panstrongylus lignarius n=1 Tax=Rhodnius prolixus TaxID=13249 RepID=A0A4P6DCT4_RHOPR
MELRTPVLLLALLGACSGSIPCPQACRCDRKSFSGAIARCSELDPDVQRFPLDITRLVVENYHGERDLALTDRMFSDMGLERVTVIKIVNSTLRDIQVSAFHGLHNLQEVDFSHNRLILIHPDTFKNNKNLARVVLKGNPLQLTQVLEQKDHHFLNSESLRELDLSHCRLTQIAPKTFSNLRGLELLDLSGNDLTEIKADTLANLESLEDLYLAYNSISKIDPNAFNDIDDMIKLSLRGNPIKTLEGIEVPGLAELDISECDLEILAGASFRGFLDLETLNLSRNSIRDIDPEAFYNLLNLKYLDLSFNMIRGPLDDSLFSLNQKLETISLAGNKELKVFKELFGSFSRLYHIDLSDCGLIDLSDSAFINMYNLARVNMSNNYLQHLKPHLFEALTHLSVLDLSNNRLHYLNNKLFSTNKKLIKLSLAGNFFRHVPAVLFQTTPILEWLDLSNCRIVTLWNITEAIILKDKKYSAIYVILTYREIN